jgi:hypothetical protein
VHRFDVNGEMIEVELTDRDIEELLLKFRGFGLGHNKQVCSD